MRVAGQRPALGQRAALSIVRGVDLANDAPLATRPPARKHGRASRIDRERDEAAAVLAGDDHDHEHCPGSVWSVPVVTRARGDSERAGSCTSAQ
ncbi:hypothetical protein CFB47_32610 [Burkholderia sp. AU27893]|uniref:Uncharacterized protein n=1 Tax=Burkholderia contaminans TaxID=488447 RepID=A0A2S5DQI4_9BURK|nr:hypothetical protein CFB47_32610 [Burkholderia sp. AU27893]POZ81312.1 hypothetical protein C3743_37580 [Burkholderia contaminans]